MFKDFFNKLLSARTVNIIVGTCLCILLILVTLAFIETGFFPDERPFAKGSRLDKFVPENNEEEYKELSIDTLQGDMFSFKNYRVLPFLEVKKTTMGDKKTILNFKLFDVNSKTEQTLFPSNQKIHVSKLVKTERCLLWMIETWDKYFYLYDERTDQLLSVEIPKGFYLIYPEQMDDSLENSEERDSEFSGTTSHVVELNCQPFSIQENQLLICAESYKNKDKCYWLYNLDTYEIKSIGF